MSDNLVLDTKLMDWESGLEAVGRMSGQFRDNLGGSLEDMARVFARYHQKTLRVDPCTTRRLDLVRLDPGYADLSFGYHDSVEECFCLEGEIILGGEGPILAGEYFWRPPGWVHAGRTTTGSLALMSLEGVSEGDLSGPVSRHVRPADQAGTNAKWPGSPSERSIGRRGWVRRLDTALTPWIPGTVFARSEGHLEGFDVEHVSVKVLSKNLWTGAQTLLMKLDPGYRQSGPGRHAMGHEFFVLTGSLALGKEELGEGSYAYWPGGSIGQVMTSERGATLFWKADGWLDFTAEKTDA